MKKKIKSFFKTSNVLLFSILSLAFFVRIYRINELLGFWYDQGRDALVIWDLWHKGKLFLIGPMMGFTGIFRGPWYYWLIAPFYLLGKGNALWPMYFLILTTVLAIFILYIIGKEIAGEKAGLIAVFIASISYYLVSASRWLSNPTPMFFISALLVWAVFQFLKKKIWSLPLIAFLVGMALNFGAAAEVFYIPAVLIILFWKRKSLPNIKILSLSLFLFFMAFLPQTVFEIRHPGVFSTAIKNFLIEDKSFTISFWEIIRIRASFYYQLIASKFWINNGNLFAPFLILIIGRLALKWKEFWKNEKFRVIIVFTLAPFLGTLFFRGNQGNIYDYYFTGYYLFFILLLSLVLARLSENFLGKAVLAIFLIIFSWENYHSLRRDFEFSLSDPKIIAFKNQTSAMDWIYKDAKGEKFNVDTYVPPVIPYAYDYLFLWYGTNSCGEDLCGLEKEKQLPLLYTLYEVDPPHPERLERWLNRQKGIGKVEKEERFGGIIIQRRIRIRENCNFSLNEE